MQKEQLLAPAVRAKLAYLAELLSQASVLAHDISQDDPENNFAFPDIFPLIIPQDQAWFWSKEWQESEREVEEALNRGEYKDYDRVEDALAALNHRA